MILKMKLDKIIFKFQIKRINQILIIKNFCNNKKIDFRMKKVWIKVIILANFFRK